MWVSTLAYEGRIDSIYGQGENKLQKEWYLCDSFCGLIALSLDGIMHLKIDGQGYYYLLFYLI